MRIPRFFRNGARITAALLSCGAFFFIDLPPAEAQMVTGSGMRNFDRVFGVRSGERVYPFDAVVMASGIPGGILFPKETGKITFQIISRLKEPIETAGRVEIVPYGTKGIPGDIWLPEVIRRGPSQSVPFEARVSPDGFQNVTVTVVPPETKGGYALIVDLGRHGRRFLTSVVRTFRPNPRRLQYPKFSLDHLPDEVLHRLGVQAIRMGVEWWLPDDPEGARRMERLDREIRALRENNITVMLMVGASPVPQPLGRPRPHLKPDGTMTSSKSDMAWLPAHDGEFRKWVARIAARHGWPKGPVTSFALWNEPWEGLSISGWGADMIRFREIFSSMARGVEDARRAGADVLIAGADSSSNTWDKFFSDGSTDYLKWLDAVTIHYQGMASPAVYRMWRERKSLWGRVRIWDTESWVANTDDRVAAVVATNRAAGYDRSMGIYGGNIASDRGNFEVRQAGGGTKLVETPPVAWSTAAAVGAMQHFLGERDFRELLYRNGLPWVMVFDGLDGRRDDGTVVVVGDIGEAFGHDNVLFRNVRTLGKKDVNGVRRGTLSIPSSSAYSLYDFYGNPVAANAGRIVVPLDHRGFFLRPSGRPGSFAKLLTALRAASLSGFEPVEIVPIDWTARVSSRPPMRVRLTNVLNRPVSGRLSARSTGLTLRPPATSITLHPGETKTVPVRVTGGKERTDNAYPVEFRFDAGRDGAATLRETMHANVITKRTIRVDGRLEDWKGTLPQGVSSKEAAGRTVTEASWFPFVKFDPSVGSGFATGYAAYDTGFFYFAAKTADSTPDEGTVRMATRDDNAFFYPAISYEPDPDATLQWRLVEEKADPADTSQLRLPSGNGRVKSYWEDTDTNLSFALDLSLPKDRLTRVAVYLGPWGNHEGIGVQAIVTDRNGGKELDRRRTERLWNGAYLVWDLTGDVRLRIRPGGDWYTAKVAGVFLDTPDGSAEGSPPNTPGGAFARFVKTDLDTKGEWRGVYGEVGYVLPGFETKLPDGVVFTMPTELVRREHRWPDGVRRFSYRDWPILPVGHFNPAYDSVQIAFNVLPASRKTTLMALPGTMPKFVQYHDTDYEYALNAVARKYGGGTEIWRLLVPGMPRKHFYPRQPKSKFDGPVKGERLAIRHDGGTRVVECAIPWSEIPAVRDAMKAGKPVKFSFLVNDAGGGGLMELGRGRSVAKLNPSFHVDWAEHWANEIEFGWER